MHRWVHRGLALVLGCALNPWQEHHTSRHDTLLGTRRLCWVLKICGWSNTAQCWLGPHLDWLRSGCSRLQGRQPPCTYQCHRPTTSTSAMYATMNTHVNILNRCKCPEQSYLDLDDSPADTVDLAPHHQTPGMPLDGDSCLVHDICPHCVKHSHLTTSKEDLQAAQLLRRLIQRKEKCT